jgi:predicted HTH transcriptional regulator
MALRQTQSTFKSDSPDWTPWLTFLLRCLVRQKERLESKMQFAQVEMEKLSPLAAQIIGLIEGSGRITVAQTIEHLGQGVSRNTVKATLQSLVKRGWLASHGKGRGAFYSRQ